VPSLLPNGTDTGFRGFFQPRYLNGSWGFQDPLYCSQLDLSGTSECSLQNTAGETFESSIWEYGFFAPHDQGTLQTLYGGAREFVRRLNFLHDAGVGYIGNEPSFLTVFQYHYAGRPGLSARRSRYYLGNAFTPGLDGLPGNDDSGAMGSYVTFSMMGLFPNPGQDVYLIIPPPYFRSVAIRSPVTGAVARVTVANYDAALNGVNSFVQNATLDGAPYTKNYLTHDFFLGGGELALHVGPVESAWGTAPDDRPPSVGAYPVDGAAAAQGGSGWLGTEMGGQGPPERDLGRPRRKGTVAKGDVCDAQMSGFMGLLMVMSSLVL
jgi:putative alpha-1,2-mannosidase